MVKYLNTASEYYAIKDEATQAYYQNQGAQWMISAENSKSGQKDLRMK